MRRLCLPRRDKRFTIEEQDEPNYEEGRHEDRAVQAPSARRQPQLEPATTGDDNRQQADGIMSHLD